MFRSELQRAGYAPVVLPRALGDAGVATSSLIPWYSRGAYVAATLVITNISFGSFVVFCLLSRL